MKIGIEASAVFRSSKTGVGWYAQKLVEALAAAMPEDELELCYISFITKQPAKLTPSPENVRYRRISLFPGKVYNALDHYLVPPPFDLLAGVKTDVFLFPNYFRWPLALCRKSVVVIHDLAFLDKPQFLVPRHQKYMVRRVGQSVRRADHVVAVSAHTKKRLAEQYGLDPAKITVVEPALDQGKFKPAPPEAVEKVKEKYGIGKEYLLFLGTTDPRKNVDGIVKAYGLLPEAVQDRYQLVLAGAPGRDWGWAWYDEQIDALIAKLPQGAVIRTGYLDEGDKEVLLSGAKLFVWPSHYEGWGMPILEAEACGVPVVTARNSSLPEAGGEAAAYVEQTKDPAELAELVQELLGDEARLAKMRAAGFEHAKRFTWRASGEKLAEVLRSLGN